MNKEIKIKMICYKYITEFLDNGLSYEEIRDAMLDGEFLAKTDITKDICEDIFAIVQEKINENH